MIKGVHLREPYLVLSHDDARGGIKLDIVHSSSSLGLWARLWSRPRVMAQLPYTSWGCPGGVGTQAIMLIRGGASRLRAWTVASVLLPPPRDDFRKCAYLCMAKRGLCLSWSHCLCLHCFSHLASLCWYTHKHKEFSYANFHIFEPHTHGSDFSGFVKLQTLHHISF